MEDDLGVWAVFLLRQFKHQLNLLRRKRLVFLKEFKERKGSFDDFWVHWFSEGLLEDFFGFDEGEHLVFVKPQLNIVLLLPKQIWHIPKEILKDCPVPVILLRKNDFIEKALEAVDAFFEVVWVEAFFENAEFVFSNNVRELILGIFWPFLKEILNQLKRRLNRHFATLLPLHRIHHHIHRSYPFRQFLHKFLEEFRLQLVFDVFDDF